MLFLFQSRIRCDNCSFDFPAHVIERPVLVSAELGEVLVVGDPALLREVGVGHILHHAEGEHWNAVPVPVLPVADLAADIVQRLALQIHVTDQRVPVSGGPRSEFEAVGRFPGAGDAGVLVAVDHQISPLRGYAWQIFAEKKNFLFQIYIKN